jgi:hypothetical protein
MKTRPVAIRDVLLVSWTKGYQIFLSRGIDDHVADSTDATPAFGDLHWSTACLMIKSIKLCGVTLRDIDGGHVNYRVPMSHSPERLTGNVHIAWTVSSQSIISASSSKLLRQWLYLHHQLCR